jgi:hypothetical protein
MPVSQHLEHAIFISVIQLPQANGSPAKRTGSRLAGGGEK